MNARPLSPRLRVAELAEALRVTPRMVQNMAARGELPGAAKIGKLWTFDKMKFNRFLASRQEVYGALAVEELERVGAKDRAFERHDGPTDRVYVIGYGPYVKIGFSSAAKGHRHRTLQTASPEELIVYGAISGGREIEANLHKRFASYRLRGEWFRKRGSLAKWIADGCPATARHARVLR